MALNDVECCDFYQVHEDVVRTVRDKMPDEDVLYDLAEVFKVFGDSTRIKILYVLSESEMCVCDIAQLLNMNQSAISHQLRILKQNQLVKSRRGRESGVLLSGGRACEDDYEPGDGAYFGVRRGQKLPIYRESTISSKDF